MDVMFGIIWSIQLRSLVAPLRVNHKSSIRGTGQCTKNQWKVTLRQNCGRRHVREGNCASRPVSGDIFWKWNHSMAKTSISFQIIISLDLNCFNHTSLMLEEWMSFRIQYQSGVLFRYYRISGNTERQNKNRVERRQKTWR